MSEYTATISMERTALEYPEPHIVITEDRTVLVPDELREIAVQLDKDVETVTFDCPRYWDGRDLYTMHIYIHYRRADGRIVPYLCENLAIDAEDESIIHFDWTIDDVVTLVSGKISFLVCAKISNNEGVLEKRWSSRLNQEMVVLEGLDPGTIIVDEPTKDFIEQILLRMDTAAAVAFEKAAEAEEAAGRAETAAENAVRSVESSLNGIRDEKISDIRSAGVEEVNRIDEKANERLGDFDAVGAVRFDRQELSQTQKEQAKANVDAGGAIVCESSGETVTIADASDQPLRGLKLYGKTTQDETPTPENPVELKNAVVSMVGSVGTNLIPFPYDDNSKTSNGITWTVNADGSITANGTASDSSFFALTYGYIWNPTSVVVGDDSAVVNGKRFTQCNYDANNKTLFLVVGSGTAVTNKVFYPMVNIGSEKLPYEPYKGGTATLAQPVTLPGIPVSSGGNYTDASGQQWISDEMDFARGVYVQRVGVTDMGTMSWSSWGDAVFGSSSLKGIIKPVADINDVANAICESYGVWSYMLAITSTLRVGLAVSTAGSVALYTGTSMTLEAFKVAMSGVMLCYELETPVETPISETDLTAYRTLHTNKPNTTVYTDSNAGMTVVYAADTKTYIDNKFAELAAAVLQNA